LKAELDIIFRIRLSLKSEDATALEEVARAHLLNLKSKWEEVVCGLVVVKIKSKARTQF
jgi:hypothetical protein